MNTTEISPVIQTFSTLLLFSYIFLINLFLVTITMRSNSPLAFLLAIILSCMFIFCFF